MAVAIAVAIAVVAVAAVVTAATVVAVVAVVVAVMYGCKMVGLRPPKPPRTGGGGLFATCAHR